MSCNEWFTLAQRYRNAVKAFCEAVDTWSGLPPGAEFNKAWQLAERPRKDSGESRAALLHHEHEHCCLLDDPSRAGTPIKSKSASRRSA
jgi:hypothetical protein